MIPKTNKILKKKIYNAHIFDIFTVTIVASINLHAIKETTAVLLRYTAYP